MSLVLLARHGNTFGPGDTPVWVGAKEDLPLVESGEVQARALGEALAEAGLTPARIVSGPLKRTRRAAEIVQALTGYTGEIEIDRRLTEIDYGSWGGKSDDEIVAEYGAAALAQWRDHHRRPPGADWSPSEDRLRADAESVLADAFDTDGPVLVITSNGILRYIHAALDREATGETSDAKVKTGRLCAARRAAGAERGERLFWNAAPEADLLVRWRA